MKGLIKLARGTAKTVGAFQGYYLIFPIGLICTTTSLLYFVPGMQKSDNLFHVVPVLSGFFLVGSMLLGYRNRLSIGNQYVRIRRSVLGYSFSRHEALVSDLGVIRIGVRSGASAATATDAYYIAIKDRNGRDAFNITDYLPGNKIRRRERLKKVLKSVNEIRDATGLKIEISTIVRQDMSKWDLEL